MMLSMVLSDIKTEEQLINDMKEAINKVLSGDEKEKIALEMLSVAYLTKRSNNGKKLQERINDFNEDIDWMKLKPKKC
jgi:hypothetical protein